MPFVPNPEIAKLEEAETKKAADNLTELREKIDVADLKLLHAIRAAQNSTNMVSGDITKFQNDIYRLFDPKLNDKIKVAIEALMGQMRELLSPHEITKEILDALLEGFESRSKVIEWKTKAKDAKREQEMAIKWESGTKQMELDKNVIIGILKVLLSTSKQLQNWQQEASLSA